MKTILYILSCFFLACAQAAYGQMCWMQCEQLCTDPLQSLDCRGRNLYPVTLDHHQIRCLLVPASLDPQAQALAAATYAQLKGRQFSVIVMLCSSDQSDQFHGIALPLHAIAGCRQGIDLDWQIIGQLSQNSLFHYFHLPFCDHASLQFQLELLGLYAQRGRVVPLVVGCLSCQQAELVVQALLQALPEQSLLIISCDLGKYVGCTHENVADASQLCHLYDQDAIKVQAVQSGKFVMNPELFEQESDASLFSILYGYCKVGLLPKISSLLVGYSWSVGGVDVVQGSCMADFATYASFIVQESSLLGYRNRIGWYEQQQLLQCARTGLFEYFYEPCVRQPCMLSYEMVVPSGVFASLSIMSDHGPILQGCMGRTHAQVPLYKMVRQMCQQAAYKDVRFYPIRQRDLDRVIISLSVICDLHKVSCCEELCATDGLLLRYDDKKAICLPCRKAVSDWSYESALNSLSQQIAAQDLVWKKPRAKIFKFRTLDFQEE